MLTYVHMLSELRWLGIFLCKRSIASPSTISYYSLIGSFSNIKGSGERWVGSKTFSIKNTTYSKSCATVSLIHLSHNGRWNICKTCFNGDGVGALGQDLGIVLFCMRKRPRHQAGKIWPSLKHYRGKIQNLLCSPCTEHM